MQLHDALEQIAQIRQHIARTETFRGYRSQTTAFTGVVALTAAVVQSIWRPSHPEEFMLLWFSAAALSVAVVGIEMTVRCVRCGCSMQRAATGAAVEQFVPCLAAGALLTFVLLRFAEQTFWMLPGLWAILFSLGIFASRRLLPRGMVWVAGYYLLCGLLCIALAPGVQTVPPWSMALTFGVGQLFTAAVLYWSLERNHAEQ